MDLARRDGEAKILIDPLYPVIKFILALSRLTGGLTVMLKPNRALEPLS
jgi:hypothetical protein